MHVPRCAATMLLNVPLAVAVVPLCGPAASVPGLGEIRREGCKLLATSFSQAKHNQRALKLCRCNPTLLLQCLAQGWFIEGITSNLPADLYAAQKFARTTAPPVPPGATRPTAADAATACADAISEPAGCCHPCSICAVLGSAGPARRRPAHHTQPPPGLFWACAPPARSAPCSFDRVAPATAVTPRLFRLTLQSQLASRSTTASATQPSAGAWSTTRASRAFPPGTVSQWISCSTSLRCDGVGVSVWAEVTQCGLRAASPCLNARCGANPGCRFATPACATTGQKPTPPPAGAGQPFRRRLPVGKLWQPGRRAHRLLTGVHCKHRGGKPARNALRSGELQPLAWQRSAHLYRAAQRAAGMWSRRC